MADTITVKQLADQAGVKPPVLRRILRHQFPRETKGKTYSWQPDDLQIELILKAVYNHKANATQSAEAPKTEEPETEKPEAEKPATKPVPKPKAKKANSKPIRKTADELKAQGVDIKPETIG